MAHDVFDVYSAIIKDTSELNDRRRQLDSLYVTLITFILTGDAYVAFNSAFNNWFLVVVTMGISMVGWTVTTRWRAGLRNLSKILEHRYEYLRSLEQTDELKLLGANVYTIEWERFYKPGTDRRFRSVTNSLQVTFLVVFVFIPTVLLALTAIETIPLIHGFIPAAIMQYIRPIVPGRAGG